MIKTFILTALMGGFFVSSGFCSIKELYDRMIPAVTTDNGLKNHLVNQDVPVYLRKHSFNADDNTYTFVNFSGASHLGTLYIIPNKGQIYALNSGRTYSVLTKEEMPFLKYDEAMVISATGGTGEHHVYAQIISLGKVPKVLASFPLNGYSAQGINLPPKLHEKRDDSALDLTYQYDSMTMKDDTLIIKGKFVSKFTNVDRKDQPEAHKHNFLKSANDPFTITIDKDRKVHLQGSKGVKNHLKDLTQITGDEITKK